MDTCGTYKYLGTKIEGYGEQYDYGQIETGYFVCDLIKHLVSEEVKKGLKAFVQDGSDYYAALCVESDFGCIKWEPKNE